MQIDRTAALMQGRTLLIASVLALLSLANVGLPQCRAQLELNGGYVQTHREDHGEVPSLASVPRLPPSLPKTPFSYSPDADLYFPYYNLATSSLVRSYYNAGSATARSGLSLSPPAQLPIPVSASALPWNQAGFVDYDESLVTSRDSSRKYTLTTISLPPASPLAGRESAALIAHLPAHAVFWVEGTRTKSTGRTRFFQSPPLLPGQKYHYRVRVDWIQNGQWVSQSRKILVGAGVIQAIYFRPQ
jgi:uncharacterized protein (TIGR03000 family)